MTEQERWSETWSHLGATAPEGLLTDLVARYSEPHRFYHTLQHLRECFSMLEPASHLASRIGEVQLALWFHDAVYDTRAQDNEEQIMAHQNQHVSRDPHLSEPCDA
jgi:predicted metal-dependent HD superfamily phosphohydrolase